jgi:hypothetical protein
MYRAWVVLAVLTATELASAEPSASDRATARSLAGEGYVALKKLDYATAEDRFRRANELVPAPTLVVDHARALIGLERLGEAYEEFQAVTQEAIPANAPPVWKHAVADAQRELQAVRPRVAWLTLSVKGPAEPHVEVDGRALPPEALGTRQPESPGERAVVVSASGFVAKTVQTTLTAGQDTALEIELLPEPVPKPVVAILPAAPSPWVAEADRKEKRDRTLAYVSFGVSGVGLATGAVAGILWLKSRSDINSACGGLQCSARGGSEAMRFSDDKRRYDTFGTISGIGFAVGVAGAATAAALLLLEPKADAAVPPSAASIEPYFGPSFVGARGSF